MWKRAEVAIAYILGLPKSLTRHIELCRVQSNVHFILPLKMGFHAGVFVAGIPATGPELAKRSGVEEIVNA
jgi:hypothetical protein